jgi:hypothetical protein
MKGITLRPKSTHPSLRIRGVRSFTAIACSTIVVFGCSAGVAAAAPAASASAPAASAPAPAASAPAPAASAPAPAASAPNTTTTTIFGFSFSWTAAPTFAFSASGARVTGPAK